MTPRARNLAHALQAATEKHQSDKPVSDVYRTEDGSAAFNVLVNEYSHIRVTVEVIVDESRQPREAKDGTLSIVRNRQ
jgi:hypothetical protein